MNAKRSKIDGGPLSEAGTWPPANWVAQRVRELRKARGMSAQALADRLAALGYSRLDRNVLANLENQRRQTVSIEDWLALALALDVSPLHLLVPTTGEDRLLVGHVEVDPDTARAWVRGETPMPGQDERVFRTEVPEDEWQRFAGTEED
jgi:transcriptional regulator with XRE-family HTH domain